MKYINQVPYKDDTYKRISFILFYTLRADLLRPDYAYKRYYFTRLISQPC